MRDRVAYPFLNTIMAEGEDLGTPDKWITRYVEGINADTGSRIQVSRFRDISVKVWSQMASRVTPEVAEAVCAQWTLMLPVASVRLRSAVMQASKQSMTSMLVIGRAMRLYPLFNWNQLLAHLPAESTAFRAADLDVNGNVYFGYNADIGVVKSRNFANIAWVTNELLIRFNGEAGLANYAGWTRAPKKRNMINDLITVFANVEAAGNAIDDAILPE